MAMEKQKDPGLWISGHLWIKKLYDLLFDLRFNQDWKRIE